MENTEKHAELGPLTDGLFRWLLWIFETPDFGLYVGIAIVILGIAVTVSLSMIATKRYTSVWKIRRHLLKAKDRQDFTDNYERISNMFLANPELKRAWYEFQETFILPPEQNSYPEQRYKFVQNTRRPHEYFNLNVVPALRVKPFIVPSTFVAIGLLMTFIGLVAALTNAANAFTGDSNDGAAIESAINGLLIVAGAKFFASIGGLVSSLLVSIVSSWWQNRINKVTYQLCDDLEKRTWFVSQTQVASDQYAHAIRQTDRLEELKDQLAVSIGEQFRMALDEVPQQFAGAIGGQLAPVIAAIDGMADNLGSGLGEALARSAGSMSEELRNNTEETIRTMVGELKNAAEGLGNTTTRLTQVTEGFDESAGSLSGAAGQLHQATDSLRPVLDSIEKLQQNVYATQTVFSQTLDRLQADLNSAEESIQTNVAQSRETIESLESLWGAQAEQLKLTDNQLEAAFSQIQRMTQESVAHLNEHLNKMDSSVANIGSHLHNANSELAEAVEGLDDSVMKLTKFSNQQ